MLLRRRGDEGGGRTGKSAICLTGVLEDVPRPALWTLPLVALSPDAFPFCHNEYDPTTPPYVTRGKTGYGR